jgi:hypothetical protein
VYDTQETNLDAILLEATCVSLHQYMPILPKVKVSPIFECS